MIRGQAENRRLEVDYGTLRRFNLRISYEIRLAIRYPCRLAGPALSASGIGNNSRIENGLTTKRHRSLPAEQLPYDPVDRRIIGLLQQDGRMSNSEIARRMGVAEATVRKRLNRLLSQGIILVVAVPSPETVGLTQSAIISVSCELQRVDEVAEALEALPETRYLGYSAGSYDLIMECFFYSHEHLLEFIRSRVAPIPGVRSTQTSIILKVRKFSYEWELPEMEE